MSEALRQVVWKCDRCGGDAQAIFGIFPSCKCGSTSFKAAQHPAPTAQQCHCKDRPADQCPGEWEPGCDLGANPAHVQVAQPVQQPGAEPQPSGYESTTTCYTRWVSPERWAKFSPGVQKWYRPYWAPAQRQPLTAEAVFASKDFMSMNGLYWGLGIETLMQIVRVTERECAAAWGVTLAQKGEKL